MYLGALAPDFVIHMTGQVRTKFGAMLNSEMHMAVQEMASILNHPWHWVSLRGLFVDLQGAFSVCARKVFCVRNGWSNFQCAERTGV